MISNTRFWSDETCIHKTIKSFKPLGLKGWNLYIKPITTQGAYLYKHADLRMRHAWIKQNYNICVYIYIYIQIAKYIDAKCLGNE